MVGRILPKTENTSTNKIIQSKQASNIDDDDDDNNGKQE
jgi:hypothetical protein